MDTTKLIYQRTNGYVAVMAQMMPTFSATKTKNTGKIQYNDDNEQIQEEQSIIVNEGSLVYYFIVDRSGSMHG